MSHVAFATDGRIVVVDVQHLVVLGLDRVRARRGGADDLVALPGVRHEHVDVRARLLAGVGIERVADHRQPAADLLGNDRLEAVALEDRDRGVRHVLLVVVGGATVEVDDSLVRAREGPRAAALLAPLPGRLERSLPDLGERRVAMDADRPLHDRAHRPVEEDPVRDRREEDAHPADKVGLSQAPVAELGAPARLHPRPRLAVHLGDLHARRARSGTPAAAGAPVDGDVRRLGHRDPLDLDRLGPAGPEALGLGTDVLRSREEVRDPGHRADRDADVALETLVGRVPDGALGGLRDQLGDRHGRLLPGSAVCPAGTPLSDRPARRPLASATPSPQRSRTFRCPASMLPVTRTLSNRTAPSAATGRSSASVRIPARLERMARGIERVDREPIVGRRSLDGQIQEDLAQTAVALGHQSAAGNPAGGDDQGIRPDRVRPDGSGRHDCRHAAPVVLDPLDHLSDLDAPTGPEERGAKRGEEARSRHARRDEGHLERCRGEALLQGRENVGVLPKPENRRQPHTATRARHRLDRARQCIDRLRAPGGIIEAARDHERR